MLDDIGDGEHQWDSKTGSFLVCHKGLLVYWDQKGDNIRDFADAFKKEKQIWQIEQTLYSGRKRGMLDKSLLR